MTPQLLSSCRIVCDHGLSSAGNQFRAFCCSYQQRRRPTYLDFPRGSPGLFAPLLIDANNKRRLAILFVTLNYHEVVEEDRRRSSSHSNRSQLTKICSPL